ncbi:bacteriocin [Staphylococcus auricularis]|nr:bacteriocin [Staphylococcus auricularis]
MKQLNNKALKAVNGGANANEWVGRGLGKAAGAVRSAVRGVRQAFSE